MLQERPLNEWTEMARTPNIRLQERPLNERVELDRTPNTRLQEHAMNEGRVGQDPKYKAVGAWTE